MVDLAQAAVLLGTGHQAAPCSAAGTGPASQRGLCGGPEVLLPPITRHPGFSPLLHPEGFQGHTFHEATRLPGRESRFLPLVSKLRHWLTLHGDSGQLLPPHPHPSGPLSAVPGWPTHIHRAQAPTQCCERRNHDVQDEQRPDATGCTAAAHPA